MDKRIGMFEIQSLLLECFFRANEEDKEVLGKKVNGVITPVNMIDIAFLSFTTRPSPVFPILERLSKEDATRMDEYFKQLKKEFVETHTKITGKSPTSIPKILPQFNFDPTTFVKTIMTARGKAAFNNYYRLFSLGITNLVNRGIYEYKTYGKFDVSFDLINNAVYWAQATSLPIFFDTCFGCLDDCIEFKLQAYIKKIVEK